MGREEEATSRVKQISVREKQNGIRKDRRHTKRSHQKALEIQKHIRGFRNGGV